eukprot:73903_1
MAEQKNAPIITQTSTNNTLQEIDTLLNILQQTKDTKLKLHYINYLPSTRPSNKYMEFEKSLDDVKRKGFNEKKTIGDVRKYFEMFNEAGAIKDKINCKLCSFKIKFENNDDITIHKITYKGANINNGAIIEVHGGGYVMLGSRKNFRFCEIISKLTGCVVFALDYKLSPEYILPYAVNELITLYKYLLIDLNISSTKIAMTGDSAGGGMILLALQSMKYTNLLPQPCCVWLNSPWTNLANDNDSNIKNQNNEVMMGQILLDNMAGWSVGNLDAKLKQIGHNNKKNKIYSPQFGIFNGLCPMLFMVGAKEIVLDDTLICVKKAFEAGVNVRCDVDPYMCHAWASIVNIYPESLVACAKACDWILKHIINDNVNDEIKDDKKEQDVLEQE